MKTGIVKVTSPMVLGMVLFLVATPAGAITRHEVAKLSASDGAEYDRFGWSVAVHGGTAVIGAYIDDDKGQNSGSAYVFPTIKEMVIGLKGPQGKGYVEVMDANPLYGHNHMAWVRVPWPAYNNAVGGTNPCLCNLDNDPANEIVIGLDSYPTTGGYVEIKDDAVAGFAHLAWVRVPWPMYNAANGTTCPAAGDFDNDGLDELAIGLGTYPTQGGYVELKDDASSGYAHLDWTRVPWPAYNATDGATYPALYDGWMIGADLILAIGLGSYPAMGGYVETKMYVFGTWDHYTWARVHWPAYNTFNGETRPGAK
jgi:hypothetical protein